MGKARKVNGGDSIYKGPVAGEMYFGAIKR